MLADDGWRTLPSSSEARPQRVRLDDVLSVELIEGGAPEAFLLDLGNGEVLSGSAMADVVELRSDDLLLPFSAGGDPAGRLDEGDVVVHEGRAWQVFLPHSPDPTARVRIDLARPGASVDIEPESLSATLYQGEAEVRVQGEHLRVLIAYAEARAADPTGGWLSAEDAWARWRALGGNPQSSVDRLGWDRGRCRAHLSRSGVGNVDALFETRRMHGRPEVRLGVVVE